MMNCLHRGWLRVALLFCLVTVSHAFSQETKTPDTAGAHITQRALPTLRLTRPEIGVIPRATVQRDVSTRQIRRIRGRISMGNVKTAREAAERFLKDNRRTLGLSDTLAELNSIRDIESLTGHHITFQQVYSGLPVFGGQLSVHTDKIFVIQLVNDDLIPIAEPIAIQTPKEPNQAIEAAVHAVNAPSGPTENPIAEAGVLVTKGIPIAVWQVRFDTRSPGAAWMVIVDAQTNQVLSVQNIAQYFHAPNKEKKP